MSRSQANASGARLALACVLAFAACRSEPTTDSRSKFDPTAPENRPHAPRFGRSLESLSPAARKLLAASKRAGSAGAPAPPDAAGGPWGEFFDGASARPPLQEGPDDPDRIRKLLRSEGVRPEIVDSVLAESQRQGADPLLVASVIKKESTFNPRALSPAGARGVMQILQSTGRDLGVHDPEQLYHPPTNIRAGVRYLKGLFDSFSEVSMAQLSTINPFANSGVKSAIAAYNAGPGAVQKHGGIPPIRETESYVDTVLGYYTEYRRRLRDE